MKSLCPGILGNLLVGIIKTIYLLIRAFLVLRLPPLETMIGSAKRAGLGSRRALAGGPERKPVLTAAGGVCSNKTIKAPVTLGWSGGLAQRVDRCQHGDGLPTHERGSVVDSFHTSRPDNGLKYLASGAASSWARPAGDDAG